jgi:hypothetical protein
VDLGRHAIALSCWIGRMTLTAGLTRAWRASLPFKCVSLRDLAYPAVHEGDSSLVARCVRDNYRIPWCRSRSLPLGYYPCSIRPYLLEKKKAEISRLHVTTRAQEDNSNYIAAVRSQPRTQRYLQVTSSILALLKTAKDRTIGLVMVIFD